LEGRLHRHHTALARDHRGYLGSYSLVGHYFALWRGTASLPAPAPAPPKVRLVASWILTRPGSLASGDQGHLDAIFAGCPELVGLQAHVRDFARIMTGLTGHDLEKWITAVRIADSQPELASFVTGLRRDQDAVTVDLTLPSRAT
jgi:hypothetical protein